MTTVLCRILNKLPNGLNIHVEIDADCTVLYNYSIRVAGSPEVRLQLPTLVHVRFSYRYYSHSKYFRIYCKLSFFTEFDFLRHLS